MACSNISSSLGRIPVGVRNLAETLTPATLLPLNEADLEELRNWILDDGEVPKELANNLGAERSETSRGGFSRALKRRELQKLEASSAYLSSFRARQEGWQRAAEADFRVFIAQSQAFFVFFDQLNHVERRQGEYAQQRKKVLSRNLPP